MSPERVSSDNSNSFCCNDSDECNDPQHEHRHHGPTPNVVANTDHEEHQTDQTHYDDRPNAHDDINKGRITFPTGRLYGRDRELELLMDVYDGLISEINRCDGKGGEVLGVIDESSSEDGDGDSSRSIGSVKSSFRGETFSGSRVIFLSGYSGVGKTALVDEFVQQAQGTYVSESPDRIKYASGKYTEQSSASAPLSAISQVLESLAVHFTTRLHSCILSNREKDSLSKVLTKLNQSTIIGSGTCGNKILRSTFPILTPLLNMDDDDETTFSSASDYVHPSMNAIKEYTRELLTIICKSLEKPLVIFLDDMQWADEASIDILSLLLTSNTLNNILWICAYRSNEVNAEHSFIRLMDSVTKARSINGKNSRRGSDGSFGSSSSSITPVTVETIDLFSLSPDAIAGFIADCVKKESASQLEIAELAEAVYKKTMGNIFFVKQALEELVRKNVLFYDLVSFEWRWAGVSKVEMVNYISDDVVEAVMGKITEMSDDMQHLLIVMAHVPHVLDVPLLVALLNMGEHTYEQDTIKFLLEEAADDGMLMYSVENENYIIAHDRIRQACIKLSSKQYYHDELLLHISEVLIAQAGGSETDWYLFVAADLLDGLPPHMINLCGLAHLLIRVSKISRSKAAPWKEHSLLMKGLESLKSSGSLWKEYSLTLELYNAIILSEYSFGSFAKAMIAIEEVIKNGRSLDDKLHAYTHQVLCKCDETRDYSQGVDDGLKVLALYGHSIPTKPSKAFMMKEEAKLKVALRYHSYSRLSNLEAAHVPIITLCKWIVRYALFTSQVEVLRLVAWKAIHCALKQGIGRDLPMMLAMLGTTYAQQGKIKPANQIANVALALSEKIKWDKGSYGMARMAAYCTVLCQLQSFHGAIDCLQQCHVDLKMAGVVETACGAMLGYTQSYFAAGLELGPLIESKLFLVEEYCREVERSSFLITFEIFHQFALNLRKRTDKPTEFEGPIFHEKEVLDAMDGPGHSMVLRDSSSHRLQLAFIFWDEDTMVGMLDILAEYPLTDNISARLHNRLCFTGLAAIAIQKARNSNTYEKLGKDCLDYFAHLARHGSVNAQPVYLFMLALDNPSRPAFNKAIDACTKANFIHLEAIALERYAVYLHTQGDTQLADECITNAYWLYQDWGAHAKALQMSHQHGFLKTSKRNNEKSVTSSIDSTSRPGQHTMYKFNSTLKSRKRVLVPAGK